MKFERKLIKVKKKHFLYAWWENCTRWASHGAFVHASVIFTSIRKFFLLKNCTWALSAKRGGWMKRNLSLRFFTLLQCCDFEIVQRNQIRSNRSDELSAICVGWRIIFDCCRGLKTLFESNFARVSINLKWIKFESACSISSIHSDHYLICFGFEMTSEKENFIIAVKYFQGALSWLEIQIVCVAKQLINCFRIYQKSAVF